MEYSDYTVRSADNFLDGLKTDTLSKKLQFNFNRHQAFPERNAWLSALEHDIVSNAAYRYQPHDRSIIRKVVPTFVTWDEYKIRLIIWKSNQSINDVKETISQLTNFSSSDFKILAVIEGCDKIEPLDMRFFKLTSGFYFICVPILFNLRINRTKYLNSAYRHRDAKINTENNRDRFDIDTDIRMTFSDILVGSSPIQTVKDLKNEAYRQYGYPLNRYDLMFEGRCLEDIERLYTYDLHNESCIDMVLQSGAYRHIKVTTFWEKTYDLEIDTTATTAEIVLLLLHQCISTSAAQLFLHENYVNSKFIILLSGNHRVCGWEECVDRVLREEGSNTLLLSTHSNSIGVRFRIRNCPDGDEVIQVNDDSTYGEVYLRLHGVTDIPIDYMELWSSQRLLNSYDPINIALDAKTIKLRINEKIDQDGEYFAITVVFRSSITQRIYVNPDRTLSSIKYILKEQGHGTVKYLSLWYNNVRHSDADVIREVGIKENDYVYLVQDTGRINYVSYKGEEECKLLSNSKCKANALIAMGNNIFKPPYGKSKYIFCGKQLLAEERIDSIGICPDNKLFQELYTPSIIMQLFFKNNKISVELDLGDKHFLIRSTIYIWNLQPTTVNSIEQLILWRITSPNRTECLPAIQTVVDADGDGIVDQLPESGRPVDDLRTVHRNTFVTKLPQLTLMQPMKWRNKPVKVFDNTDGLQSLLEK